MFPLCSFFFNDTATTEIYTLSLHDALPICALRLSPLRRGLAIDSTVDIFTFYVPHRHVYGKNVYSRVNSRSEERFSRNAETDLVCRLLLEKKKDRNRAVRRFFPVLQKTD